MLNAVLNSKAGRLTTADDRSLRWRDLFRSSEDLLTATVLERLSYLDPLTAWSLLVTASGGELPERKMVRLEEISYWPMWAEESRSRGVEPDVFLTFDLGDPARRAHVILEAKFRDGRQSLEQWKSEVMAWAQMIAAEGAAEPDFLYLLAVGGVPDQTARTEVIRALEQAASATGGVTPEIRFAQFSWQDLARACVLARCSEPHENRVLRDMIRGLELAGYFHHIRPVQLEAFCAERLASRSWAGSFSALMSCNKRAGEAL